MGPRPDLTLPYETYRRAVLAANSAYEQALERCAQMPAGTLRERYLYDLAIAVAEAELDAAFEAAEADYAQAWSALGAVAS